MESNCVTEFESGSVIHINPTYGSSSVPGIVADRLMDLKKHVFTYTYLVSDRIEDTGANVNAEADSIVKSEEYEIEIEIDLLHNRQLIFDSIGILMSKYKVYELLFLTDDEDVAPFQGTILATIIHYWQELDKHNKTNAFHGINHIRKCSQVYNVEIDMLKKRFPFLGLPWLESLLYMKFAKCNGCMPPVWIDNHVYYDDS
jgi:hypothetical protein